ncbi:BZ3500_MvSof-1268-A1-R1_Chr10-4g03097 [Microbotryum saponariae]|uniref:BZ3500_MvSof-1268-A1-R1_Chr10-4g03097 protein n=1 Tax=Microbotryum saponariae TaxID=289078 RepID=A0A2X0L3I1_9BASI|nr:BZ3501_MvSof-1269-A2-R1_Chr10-2g02672 [Microbotryum saponariae]SDA01141.1 BZ3500_MvSof-1268-A1-R1_Chr10-4g03097 [Microbotryum saponariae]
MDFESSRHDRDPWKVSFQVFESDDARNAGHPILHTLKCEQSAPAIFVPKRCSWKPGQGWNGFTIAALKAGNLLNGELHAVYGYRQESPSEGDQDDDDSDDNNEDKNPKISVGGSGRGEKVNDGCDDAADLDRTVFDAEGADQLADDEGSIEYEENEVYENGLLYEMPDEEELDEWSRQRVGDNELFDGLARLRAEAVVLAPAAQASTSTPHVPARAAPSPRPPISCGTSSPLSCVKPASNLDEEDSTEHLRPRDPSIRQGKRKARVPTLDDRSRPFRWSPPPRVKPASPSSPRRHSRHVRFASQLEISHPGSSPLQGVSVASTSASSLQRVAQGLKGVDDDELDRDALDCDDFDGDVFKASWSSDYVADQDLPAVLARLQREPSLIDYVPDHGLPAVLAWIH